MTTETEKKMYDMKVASDALANSAGGLESAMSSLANSKLLTIISRMASGILPTFWQLQNKIRAGFTIIDQMYKRQGRATKEALEAMEQLVNLSDMAKAMEPFDGLFDYDLDNYNPVIEDLLLMTNMYDNLTKNMKGFNAIEMSLFGNVGKDKRSLEDFVELFQTTQELLQPQKDEMSKRQNAAEKAMNDKREFKKMAKDRGISGDSPFGRLRLKALRLQFKVNNTFSKIKAFDYVNAIRGASKFFFKALLAFSAIVLGLFFLKKSFDLLKEPLGEAFESIKEEVMWVLGGIFNTLSDLGSAFVLLYDGFANGEFFTVIDALLQIFAGVFKLGLQVLGGIIWLGVSSIVIVLGELLEHALSSGENFYNTLTGILLAVGVLAGYLVFIGSTIAALPYLIVAGIAGVIMLGLKNIIGFSTGGIVNSDMQIVGERGAELVSLPRGSRVHSNADSKRMLGSSGGNTINVHVNGRVGASDAEIRDIANKVAREINLRMSRTGSGVNNF